MYICNAVYIAWELGSDPKGLPTGSVPVRIVGDKRSLARKRPGELSLAQNPSGLVLDPLRPARMIVLGADQLCGPGALGRSERWGLAEFQVEDLLEGPDESLGG
jgi:hypothetical protein